MVMLIGGQLFVLCEDKTVQHPSDFSRFVCLHISENGDATLYTSSLRLRNSCL